VGLIIKTPMNVVQHLPAVNSIEGDEGDQLRFSLVRIAAARDHPVAVVPAGRGRRRPPGTIAVASTVVVSGFSRTVAGASAAERSA
jgi:hypothetical protein